jgi:ketosteroid isomerase-like protein
MSDILTALPRKAARDAPVQTPYPGEGELMPTAVAIHKNVESVRRGYQAFNAGDMKVLTELFDEHATWHAPGKSSVSGTYKGREAVFGFFGKLGQGTNGTFKAELKHALTDEDGRVACLEHVTGQRGGKKLSVDACIVFEFKNGKVISGTEYSGDLHAWETFWS